MTAQREVWIDCNGCAATHGRGLLMTLVSMVRERAAANGWVQRGRLDYCSSCVTAGRA